MVRPRGFDVDEVSEGLLNAFWLRGFARTSIPDLTAATGLLPGSFLELVQNDPGFDPATDECGSGAVPTEKAKAADRRRAFLVQCACETQPGPP